MNDQLKEALKDVMDKQYDEILANADTGHVFSENFERKINKLIRQQNKPYYHFINTVAKRVACILVIIVVASFTTIMSVEALRNAFKNFFINMFSKNSDIVAVEDDTESYPDKIEDIYTITYDLSDFNIDYEEYDDLSTAMVYTKDSYAVFYKQYVVSEYDVNRNTEDAEISHVNIGDVEAIYFKDNNEYYNIIWNNGEYVFDINTNLGENVLIDIANSVKKVEE